MIKIFEDTTKNPLEKIGIMSGICWNSSIDEKDKNITRAEKCISSEHGRVLEFVNVEILIDGYSARCIRELYTHIGGMPTRLQESTRYVNCNNFSFYNPFNDKEKSIVYEKIMSDIKSSYQKLLDMGASKEDSANVLPLGMNTKMILKCNLRMLVNFMNQRLCTRAYKEIYKLAQDIKKALFVYSDEWKWICDNLFVAKCEKQGYCVEENCCGKNQKRFGHFV